MRITRETLLKLARDTVQLQLQRDRRLVCIYLTGSLLIEEPLLGGTTDIDLIFVHDSEPLIEREIVRMSDEVHLDIAHYSQMVFHQPRHLRVDPWIGPFLCQNPIILHDSHHWFEFTQAAVCAQFKQPEYVYQRARVLSDQARQGWLSLHLGSVEGDTKRVLAYLYALENAANAVASFNGPPLTERRLMLQLGPRAEAAGRPGLAGGLVDLITADSVSPDEWHAWQTAWSDALSAAGRLEAHPARLDPHRKQYYTRAAASLWDSSPEAALWIALRTWTLALDCLEESTPGFVIWQDACRSLKLDKSSFPERLEQMDAYIDGVEETLDQWAREYGIETNI